MSIFRTTRLRLSILTESRISPLVSQAVEHSEAMLPFPVKSNRVVKVLNLHRDKKIVRREPGRDGKILSDHRQDGNDEVHRL